MLINRTLTYQKAVCLGLLRTVGLTIGKLKTLNILLSQF